MGEAFLDLDNVLKGKLTLEEARFLESCKSKAVEEFAYSAIAMGTALWTATWKLKRIFRINLAAGGGFYFGMWRLSRSLYSSAENILELDGSRMQVELANILATKYRNNPSNMKLFSKRFYMEKIYDDSTSDLPKLRWRYRNYFGDNIVNFQKTDDYDTSDISLSDSHNDSNNIAQGNPNPKEASDSSRINLDTKHIFRNPDVHNQMGETDPLDHLFGYSAPPVEEIDASSTSTKAPAIPNRGYKRSHRRRRMRHHEDLNEV